MPKKKLFEIESAFYDSLNPIFLGTVLPELLFNQFHRVLHITICLLVRKGDSMLYLETKLSFPIGDNK